MQKMSQQDTIFCLKLKKNLPRIPYQPFPGALGVLVKKHTSQQAWALWLIEQTKMINEYRLDPLSKKAQDFLPSQMLQFLNLEQAQSSL